MRFCRAHVAAVRGRDKDRVARVSSLTNEEPLVVVKACVDIVWEVVGKDCGDGRDGVIREGEASLCRGGCGSVCKGASGFKDRDVSRDRGSGRHRGSEVFTSRRGNENVIRVDGDVFVERGEEEGVENFLGDLGGCRRHCR